MANARPQTRRALVVGCGIGGPTVAMALLRAGIEPAVFEAHPHANEETGSFLNLASNGLDALRSTGFDPALLAEAFPTPRMVMWSGTGKRLGEVANGTELEDGTVSVTIRRARLHHALRREAERRGVRVEHGKRLAGIDADGKDAVVRFEDGTSVAGDFVIGADGIHARTRYIVDPGAPRPRYTGQLSVGGVVRCSAMSPTPGAYHMIFGRRAFFGYSVTRGGDAYWFANDAMEEEPARDALRDVGADDWKRRLSALFADDAGPALRMIDETNEFVASPIHDLPTVPRWHDGRTVLLGDAAHATSPSSGQGAAMAIEDAVVLAKCLRDEVDTARAFSRYEGLRRDRVERVVRYSKRIGSTKVPGPVGRWFRDLLMPLALKFIAGGAAHAWLYDHRIDWNERVA